jgi:hypothetical protein
MIRFAVLLIGVLFACASVADAREPRSPCDKAPGFGLIDRVSDVFQDCGRKDKEPRERGKLLKRIKDRLKEVRKPKAEPEVVPAPKPAPKPGPAAKPKPKA